MVWSTSQGMIQKSKWKIRVIMKCFVVLLSLFTLTSPLLASDEVADRTEITMKLDKEGEPSLDYIFIPFYWSKNTYSGIGFSTSQSSETDVIEGFSESRLSTTYDQTNLRLNLYTHEWNSDQLTFSLGGLIDFLTIKRLEFGYAHFPASLGDDWVALDNEVEIKVIKPVIQGIVEKEIPKTFSVRGILDISPSSSLSVEQETRFKPIVATAGKSSSSSSQRLTYTIGIEMLFKTGAFIDIGIVASHEFLPLNYDIEILDYDSVSGTFGFKTSKIEVEETTNKVALRLLFNDVDVGGLQPAIGYGYESFTSKDVINNRSETESGTFIVVGFEKRF